MLTGNGTSAANGVIYQWEESDDNGVTDAWDNVTGGSGAQTRTYTTPVLNTARWYRLKSTCTLVEPYQSSYTTGYQIVFLPSPDPDHIENGPCEGGTLQLTGLNNAPNQTMLNIFEWNGPNNFHAGPSASANNVSVPNVALSYGGQWTLTVKNQYECSLSINFNPVIHPRPVPSVVTGSLTDASCNGGSDGSFSLTSSGTEPFTFNVNGTDYYDNPSLVENLPAGVYTVHVSDDNSCESNPDIIVTVGEPDAITIASGPTAIAESCNGANDGSLSVTVQGGTGPYTYTLSGAGSGSNGTGSFTGLGAGMYNVDVVDAHGCTFNALTNYQVPGGGSLIPAGPVSGLGGICKNQSANFSIPAYPGAISYSWTLPTGGSITSGANTPGITASFNNSAASGNVCVQVVSACGTPAQVCKFVELRTQKAAQPASITSFNAACVGDLLTFSVPPSQRTDYYLWTVPSGKAVIQSGQGTTSITVLFTSNVLVTDSVKVVAQNCIGSSLPRARGLKSTIPTQAPGTISGDAKACPGQTLNYSIADIGAPQYEWSVTGGSVSGGQNTTAANIAFTSLPATVNVRAKNGCGVGPMVSKSITANTPSVPGAISGPTTGVCFGPSNYNYSIAAVANADGYQWSATAGGNVVSGQNTTNASINFPTTFVSATISVRSVNLCGVSTPRNLAVSGTLGAPGAISGPVSALCNGSGSYSISPVAGATGYSWKVYNGNETASSNPTPTSLDITFGLFTTATVCVTADNICGSSPQKCLTVKGTPPSVGAISGPATFCPPQLGVAYSCGPAASATGYSWTKPSGAQIASGNGTQSILVNFNSGTGGNITVKPVNSCGNGPASTLGVSVACSRLSVVSSSSNESRLTAIPNPTDGDVYVSFESALVMEYSMQVTDLTGRVLQTVYAHAVEGMNQQYFDMSGYAKGVYLVSLKGENTTGLIRIVVE